MPATTPSGWRSEWLSTLVPTFSVTSPFRRCGAPMANSTTSSPRVTSPRASSWVLPCSDEISSAILSAFSCKQELEAVEDARPAQRRGLRPGRPRRLGGGDDRGDLLGRGEGNPLLDRAGRRVEDVREPARAALDARAADIVGEIGHWGFLLACWARGRTVGAQTQSSEMRNRYAESRIHRRLRLGRRPAVPRSRPRRPDSRRRPHARRQPGDAQPPHGRARAGARGEAPGAPDPRQRADRRRRRAGGDARAGGVRASRLPGAAARHRRRHRRGGAGRSAGRVRRRLPRPAAGAPRRAPPRPAACSWCRPRAASRSRGARPTSR